MVLPSLSLLELVKKIILYFQDETELDLEWKDGNECGLLLFEMCKKVNLCEDMKEKIQNGDSALWDIPLVTAAIRAVTQQSNGEFKKTALSLGTEFGEIAEKNPTKDSFTVYFYFFYYFRNECRLH
jgi:hypothetical protein